MNRREFGLRPALNGVSTSAAWQEGTRIPGPPEYSAPIVNYQALAAEQAAAANYQRRQAAAAANYRRQQAAAQAAANAQRAAANAAEAPFRAEAAERMAALSAGTARSIASEGVPVANVQPRGRRHSNSNLGARQAAAIATAANAARRAPIDRLTETAKPWWKFWGGKRTRRNRNKKSRRPSSRRATRRR